MTEKTGIVILTAGRSSRLGTPKQLLTFEGKSLLRRIADEASLHPDHQVLVVLGAWHEMTSSELTGAKVEIVVNAAWKDGMSGSIQTGLESLLQANPELEQCIISVCDQPHVNASVFHELKILAKETGKGIITTGFADTWGVPVLFSKPYFNELLSLKGDHGAKKVVEKHGDDMAVFPFAPAQFDIDTWEDYYGLNQHMVSVEEAKKIITFHLPQAKTTPAVPIQNALGHSLATDVFARYAIPNFAQSSMDGYAIRYDEKEQKLPVVDEVPAGAATQKTLLRGQAMRIFTGAPLPLGADTVVMQEKVSVTNGKTLLIDDPSLQSGENVRPKGSEVAEGALAMSAGSLLSPAALGYLAGIGCDRVDIVAAPRVGLILTGNELKPPGTPLGFGQVYESNSYQLTAALSQLGIKESGHYHALDDRQQLKEIMEDALLHYDILLLVGGVSVGNYDYVAQVASECGIERRFHRVRQKPGKPLFFGTKQEKLVFGLPGNPSSALTCFYLYVAPALEKLMQLPNSIKKITATISLDYHKKAGLTHFLKGFFEGHSVTPLHAQESYRLQSFAQANCLIVLEEDSEGCKAGDEVSIYTITS